MFQEAYEAMGATLDVVPIVFSHNSITTNLSACIGASSKAQETDQRIKNIEKRCDIMLSVAAFETAFGSGERPRENDTVTLHNKTWRVKPLASGEPSWRYSDPYRVRIRIHLLEVS